MKVVGVDLSLTATGIAIIEADEVGVVSKPVTKLIKSKPEGSFSQANSIHGRFGRLEAIAAAVIAECKDADLVLIEGPSLGSKHGSQWDRAGLWWWVVSILETLGTPIAEVPPTTLKKWATNSGAASKTAVGVGISKIWPDAEIKDDNQADALCLATIAAQRLGFQVPSKAYHDVAVAKVNWPRSGVR